MYMLMIVSRQEIVNVQFQAEAIFCFIPSVLQTSSLTSSRQIIKCICLNLIIIKRIFAQVSLQNKNDIFCYTLKSAIQRDTHQ